VFTRVLPYLPIYFNVISPPIARSPQRCLSLWLAHQDPICITLVSHAPYIPCLSHPRLHYYVFIYSYCIFGEQLGRPRRRWVDNIKMDLLEVGCIILIFFCFHYLTLFYYINHIPCSTCGLIACISVILKSKLLTFVSD
jgi:hypothetical protein